MKGAIADQWTINGAFDQSLEFNDNIALQSQPVQAYGYLMKPSFKAGWSTRTTNLGINGGADIRRYNDERWNCENFTLGSNFRHSMKRHVFSLTGGYSVNCTYSQQDLDTGILLPNNQNESYSLSPSWTWFVSHLDRVTLSPSYNRSTFTSYRNGFAEGEDLGLNFQNNESYGLNLTEQHEWTHRLKSNASLSFSHSEFGNSDPAQNQSTNSQNLFGFQGGLNYELSRHWIVNAGGGGQWVQSPGSSGDGDLLFGETLNSSINYTGRNQNASLSLSRAVSPSAFGQLRNISSVSASYSYKLSREWSFNMRGSYEESESLGQSLSLSQLAQKRTFMTASVGLSWSFARDWNLSANYNFRRQDYSSGSTQLNSALIGARESNAISLNLKYNWDGLRDAH